MPLSSCAESGKRDLLVCLKSRSICSINWPSKVVWRPCWFVRRKWSDFVHVANNSFKNKPFNGLSWMCLSRLNNNTFELYLIKVPSPDREKAGPLPCIQERLHCTKCFPIFNSPNSMESSMGKKRPHFSLPPLLFPGNGRRAFWEVWPDSASELFDVPCIRALPLTSPHCVVCISPGLPTPRSPSSLINFFCIWV